MNEKAKKKLVYQGDFIQVMKQDVCIHDKTYSKDVILHPGGVGILAFVSGCILLVKQYRYAIDQITLEIPAGKLKSHEDPIACGKRELEEETSFTTSTLHPICMMYSTPGVCNEKIYLYYTTQMKRVKDALEMDEDEDIDTQWIPLTDCLAMIQDGIIQDAKTILAIQYAALYLKKV